MMTAAQGPIAQYPNTGCVYPYYGIYSPSKGIPAERVWTYRAGVAPTYHCAGAVAPAHGACNACAQWYGRGRPCAMERARVRARNGTGARAPAEHIYSATL